MLPIWRRSCALITGMPLGKGLDAVGGAIPPGSVRWGSDWHPASLLGPVPFPTHSLGRERGLGWLPWSPWKRLVGYASLLMALGAEGTKAAVVILCL